jgi:hypothetical protein
MLYNSPEHFLAAQSANFVEVVAAAQRAAGGHYAAYTPAQLQQNAANDASSIMETMRTEFMDSAAMQAGIRDTYGRGIDLDDLTRMAGFLEEGLVALVDRELQDQPDLAVELTRRIRHFNTRFRSNVTSVKLDITLGRMKRPNQA